VFVLLESGVLVGPGWLAHLLAALEANPRNGLAGPSTNKSWNEQCVFPGSGNNPAEIAITARRTEAKFGNEVRTLDPLYSLADFCYVVRREVIEVVGAADEGYSLGPCWEMDYNIRAARAGWRGVWACAAYVHRAPFTERRRREEARLFDASKRRYQDKFCGARLRGGKTDYRTHCRGDSCPNFAPAQLLAERGIIPTKQANLGAPNGTAAPPAIEVTGLPLVSCIMPTCDRLPFVRQALQGFLCQEYGDLELIIVDDGPQPVAPLLPDDPRIRLIRLPEKKCVGTKRNLGCAAARGDLIVHWDDDDWYRSDRVLRQARVFAEKRVVVCGTSVLFYFEPATGRAWRYCYTGTRAWVAGNTLAYRKSWWSAHPFPEIQVGEDSRFVWNAPAQAIRDLRQPELCVARIHDGNTSRKATSSAFWQSWQPQELEKLLGPDWNEFLHPAGAPSLASAPPLVSCIMPTFNRRPFLPLALAAFLAQDYPNKELIIVDDGEDQVLDCVRGLNPVRHISLPQRASIGRKRNLACQSARGSIIAHWDDDDWYGVGRLSHQVAPLIAGRADLTGLENAFQLEAKTGEFWRPNAELHRRMFVGNLHGGTLVYWKSLFDQGLRYPEVNLAEDAMFLRQAEQRGKRILRLDNPGAFVYVRHGRNSWRFPASVTSHVQGWERVTRPEAFSEQLLSAFCGASEANVSRLKQ
jgi:glycosyltransferase involved in cell wall biosynthesis